MLGSERTNKSGEGAIKWLWLADMREINLHGGSDRAFPMDPAKYFLPLWRVAQDEAFEDFPEIIVSYVNDGIEPAWHLYVIQLDLDRLRIGHDQVIDLLKQEGIGTSVHFIPLYLHPYYRNNFTDAKEKFPIANQVFKRIISLPISPKMTDADL